MSRLRHKAIWKIITVVVVIVAAVGLSVFGYLRYVNRNPYPGLVTDNKVVNGTIAENFANYSSLNASKSVFSAVTLFFYHNLSSNLTISALMYVFYLPLSWMVVVELRLNVTGNLSSAIRPSGFQLTVTNTWSNSLNVDNVPSWDGAFAHPLPPYSNVSTPQINSNAGGGNLAFQAKARLLNQTNSVGVNRFGLWSAMEYSYYTLSYFTGAPTGADIGKDVLHFTASLQGLGKPVFVTINVLLMDTG